MIEAVPGPNPEKLPTKLVPVETEIEAMRVVFETLRGLPFGAKMRILHWAMQRTQGDRIDARPEPAFVGEFGTLGDFPRGGA